MDVKTNIDQTFLTRLAEITEANLNNEQFGVSDLAEKAGISRSQIHRKLKSINNQSVSQFIREIRLNKAKILLEQKELTVSEIAYEVGFGSPSYFIKCFHDYYGNAPGEYMKHTPAFSENKRRVKIKTFFRKTHLKIFLSLLFFGLVIIPLLIVLSRKNESFNEVNKSIAFLPLKNISGDSDTQILADGIIEDILNRLTNIQELKVISRSSSEAYRDSTKTAPQISEELGVSHLLEGTILKEGENIRIYIQLIDASNDQNIWSAEYGKDLSGIFEFISDVSLQIARELETVLTESERYYIEKVYTENTEAYQLYQKGRFFWHRRSEEGLKKSIEYFNKAIALDPEYSLAWAGLADAYLIIAYWGWYPYDDGFLKSKEYALEAIRLDNNLAEPHVTLGSMELYYNQNWKFAEKKFLESIELNPHYSNGYLFYADYLIMLRKFDKARVNIEKAIELFPNALINYHVSSGLYLCVGKFDKALQECEKLSEIDKNYRSNYWRKFIIYYYKGDDLKAFKELKSYMLLYSPNENHQDELNQTYAESGINAVIYWLIEYRKNKWCEGLISDVGYHFNIAKLYGMIGDREKVLEHLEEGFKFGRSDFICYVYCSYEYNFLLDDPDFIALLKMAKIPLE